MAFENPLQISFPKSSEDHRLRLVGINNSIFAIVYAPLESDGPVRLFCEDWSLILLAPIKSRSNIVISAFNVLCLNEIASESGIINLHASNQLVKFAGLVKQAPNSSEFGEKGEFQFDDDPGAFLYYYRVFEGVVGTLQSNHPSRYFEAQQKFVAALCTLADKVKGNPGNLALSDVLKFWGV